MEETTKKIQKFINYFYQHWFFWSIVIILTFKSLSVNILIGTFYFTFVLFLWSLLMMVFMFLPFIFAKKNHRYALLIDLVVTLILLSTLWYHRYFEGIPSMSSLFFAKQLASVSGSFPSVFRFYDLLFFIDFPLIAYFVYFSKKRRLKIKARPINVRYNFIIFAIFLLGVSGLVYFDREDEMKRFLNNVYDTKIITTRYGILGAYFVDIYKNITVSAKKVDSAEKDGILAEAKRYSLAHNNNDLTGSSKGKNIIMIQVESLAANVIERTINGQEITPNINRIIKESDYFEDNYYEYGLGNTSDTDFSSNSSLYPMSDSSVFIRYGKNLLTSLPRVLVENGYTAFAYHGYVGDFWNRFTSYNSLGYQKFYTSVDYPNARKFNMGISDKDFVKKTLDYIENQPRPSFSYVVTLSSHTPFELPEDEVTLKINSDKITDYSKKYLKNIHHTDEAIGALITGLKNRGLYDDSLIILYGDHLPVIDSYSDDQGYADYKSDLSKKVPLLIKHPGSSRAGRYNFVTKSLDIMPTVLNLTGLETEYPVMGQDIYSSGEKFFSSVGNYSNQFTINNDYYYNNDSGKESCFSRKTKKLVELSKCSVFTKEAQRQKELSWKLTRYNLLKEIIKR